MLRTLDAGALRQQFGAGLETNSLARTLGPSSPPPLTDLFFPPVAAHWTGGRIAQRTTWQNGSTAGSRRPKRRWEAATHRKRVPAQRKAAAERQPSGTADSEHHRQERKAAHQKDAARRGRPHRARACYWYIDHTRWFTLPSQWARVHVRRRARIIVCNFDDPHDQSFLRGHDDSVVCVALSPHGTYVASGQSGENADAIVWDYATKSLKFRLSGARPRCRSGGLLPR